jgi:dolichol-phosphate mannosyltransferase
MSVGTVRVVIPVFDEADNVRDLVEEIASIPSLPLKLHVDFVDDSHNDRTVKAIESARNQFPLVTITYLHRTGADRTNGLAGAVTAGMRRALTAGHEYVLVMDGDGQHPPAVIPSMLSRLRPDTDLVVASRYIPGGSHEGLDGNYRRFISRAATWIARLLFPIRLRKVTDPMTGLFVVRASSINPDRFEATGFKILLEMILRTPELRPAEVPVIFRLRNAGDSKAAAARGVEYLNQLVRLRLGSLRLLTRRKEKHTYVNV